MGLERIPLVQLFRVASEAVHPASAGSQAAVCDRIASSHGSQFGGAPVGIWRCSYAIVASETTQPDLAREGPGAVGCYRFANSRYPCSKFIGTIVWVLFHSIIVALELPWCCSIAWTIILYDCSCQGICSDVNRFLKQIEESREEEEKVCRAKGLIWSICRVCKVFLFDI